MGIAEEHLDLEQPQRPLYIAEQLSSSMFDMSRKFRSITGGVRCDVLYGPLTVEKRYNRNAVGSSIMVLQLQKYVLVECKCDDADRCICLHGSHQHKLWGLLSKDLTAFIQV